MIHSVTSQTLSSRFSDSKSHILPYCCWEQISSWFEENTNRNYGLHESNNLRAYLSLHQENTHQIRMFAECCSSLLKEDSRNTVSRKNSINHYMWQEHRNWHICEFMLHQKDRGLLEHLSPFWGSCFKKKTFEV